MYKFKLSICIATYNRVNYLKSMLDSIFEQYISNVEIVVVDSSDNSDTENMIDENFNGLINYTKLESKGGVDKDYDISVLKSNGEYCWLLSDDDIIKPNTLNEILNYLNSQEYSVLIVNSELRSKDMYDLYRSKQLNINSNILYLNNSKDFETFFIKTINYLSFIGCVIIKRQLWITRNRENYYGTEFVHIGVIFQEYLPQNVLIIANPYISIRMNNSQWTKRAFKIWFINWYNLLHTFSLINYRITEKIITKNPSHQFIKLLYYRALDIFDLEQYLIINNEFKLSKVEKLKLKTILSINQKFIFYLIKFYSILLKRKWMLIDLQNSKMW